MNPALNGRSALLNTVTQLTHTTELMLILYFGLVQIHVVWTASKS